MGLERILLNRDIAIAPGSGSYVVALPLCGRTHLDVVLRLVQTDIGLSAVSYGRSSFLYRIIRNKGKVNTF